VQRVSADPRRRAADALLARASDEALLSEVRRRSKSRPDELPAALAGRLGGRSLRRFLDAVDDRALLDEVDRRVKCDLSLEDLPARQVARLAAAFRVTRPLDYPREPIRLAVGSPAATKRLRSVSREPFTVAWIEQSLRPGDAFYDVGANVGAFALIAAALLRGSGTVVAFEPGAPTYHDLCVNVALNGFGETVVPLPLALWSRTELVPFSYRTLGSGDARHTLGRGGDGASAYTQPMPSFRLDDLVDLFDLPPPALVKLDVDGAELAVLEGAERTLRRPELRGLLVELDGAGGERNEEAILELCAGAGFAPVSRHTHDEGWATYVKLAREPA
jgi:FkbM family methyltransferase